MEVREAVAVVTGGNGGLGRRICHALARNGARVVVVYAQSWQEAEAVADQLRALGTQAIAVAADLTQPQHIGGMVERVMAEFGRLDILVNNAAFNQWIPFQDLDTLTLEVWERILRTNITGPFLCIKAVAPVMRAQGRGRIVNIASIAGLYPGGSSLAYAVSKAALIHLTRCMAVALAPEILVNCVAPGTMEGTRATANLDPAYVERARQAAALKRHADKDDVAEQVLTLVRTESTTGQTIVVDAGRFYH